MSPLADDNCPDKMCNKVDFPAPFRPTNATRALRGNTYDTSCSGNVCPSWVYDTCSICNTDDDDDDDDGDEGGAACRTTSVVVDGAAGPRRNTALVNLGAGEGSAGDWWW